ncbi:hypothetical protein Tco_0772388 [Tanacetum coccineum]|uniref:Uncharacterized protein n=1 Tax=Tanacetum coccineum TaxID=301880 RepID=A0ABQ4ZKP4_9ASTR
MSALRRSDKENRQVWSVLTDLEGQVKMEMEIPRSSEYEHASLKVTTSHEGNIPHQGWSRDLQWMMITKNAQRSDKSKEQSSKITTTMLLNVDQLQKQLDKDEFQEDGSMTAFWVYERRVNKRQMQTQESKIDMGKALDADLVDTKSIRIDSTVQDDNNRVDQYPEKCQVKSPMLDSSPDNQTTEYSKQSLESENILLKKTVAQFQKDFSRMEAHYFGMSNLEDSMVTYTEVSSLFEDLSDIVSGSHCIWITTDAHDDRGPSFANEDDVLPAIEQICMLLFLPTVISPGYIIEFDPEEDPEEDDEDHEEDPAVLHTKQRCWYEEGRSPFERLFSEVTLLPRKRLWHCSGSSYEIGRRVYLLLLLKPTRGFLVQIMVFLALWMPRLDVTKYREIGLRVTKVLGGSDEIVKEDTDD